MSSKVVKIVAGITACIISLAVIFYIINGIDALTELSEYEGDFFSATKSLSIFQLIMAIVVLLSGVFSAIISFNPSTSKKDGITFLLATALLVALEKLISIIWAFVIARHYLGPLVTLSTSRIIMVVFICLTLLFMGGAIALVRFNKEIPGGAIGATGSLWFIIALVIAVSSGTDSNGFTILNIIFLIVATIMMIATLALSMVKEAHKEMFAPVDPIILDHQVSSTPDSAEELLKLKKLLDAGAITQEEYEEKRKKYVDCL